jgi:hypothetical protein
MHRIFPRWVFRIQILLWSAIVSRRIEKIPRIPATHIAVRSTIQAPEFSLIAENKPSVVTATNISQAFWAGLCRWTSLPKTVCRPWVNALTGIANLVTRATWRALAAAPVIAANLAIALRGANA